MAFNPPGPEERLRAIGLMDGLPQTLRLALDPGTEVELIPHPQPGDWLAARPESEQVSKNSSAPGRIGRIRPGTGSTSILWVILPRKEVPQWNF
jgi:hypothetical protein